MSGKFQILGKHIKEMRDSVEKLLTNFGLTKTDYFNYDEEGNEITQPNGQKLEWTDPITNAVDLKKFQVKAIHIEDLRHYIQTFWKESWVVTIPPSYYGGSFTITKTGAEAINSITKLDAFTCDHHWYYGGGVYSMDIMAAAASTDPNYHPTGTGKGDASLQLDLSSGLSVTTDVSGTVLTPYGKGAGRVEYNISGAIFATIYLKSNLHFICKNLTYSESQVQGLIFGGNYFHIGVKYGPSPGDILYYYWYKYDIGDSAGFYMGDSWDGEFNRNLYDDFITMRHYTPPSYLSIYYIYFYWQCYAVDYDGNDYAYPTSAHQSTNIGEIQLRYISS